MTRAFFIGAQLRSRYDRFDPLGMPDTEVVREGLLHESMMGRSEQVGEGVD